MPKACVIKGVCKKLYKNWQHRLKIDKNPQFVQKWHKKTLEKKFTSLGPPQYENPNDHPAKLCENAFIFIF